MSSSTSAIDFAASLVPNETFDPYFDWSPDAVFAAGAHAKRFGVNPEAENTVVEIELSAQQS